MHTKLPVSFSLLYSEIGTQINGSSKKIFIMKYKDQSEIEITGEKTENMEGKKETEIPLEKQKKIFLKNETRKGDYNKELGSKKKMLEG